MISNHAEVYDRDLPTRIAAFFGVTNLLPLTPPSINAVQALREAKISENSAEFDGSMLSWTERTVQLGTNTITVLDHSKPPKKLEYEIAKILKLGMAAFF